jgi:hypothetical protein
MTYEAMSDSFSAPGAGSAALQHDLRMYALCLEYPAARADDAALGAVVVSWLMHPMRWIARFGAPGLRP